MQRTPYYVGVPVAALTRAGGPVRVRRGSLIAALFAIFAALMLYGGGLAVFHSGVEWGFWQGPASCAPSIGVDSAADMLNQLENAHAPSCTDAPWRILGLSFAGWNVLVSALLVVLGVARRADWPGAAVEAEMIAGELALVVAALFSGARSTSAWSSTRRAASLDAAAAAH